MLSGDIEQACRGAECVPLPAVRALYTRSEIEGLTDGKTRRLDEARTTGLQVNAVGPVHFGERCGAQQLPRGRIQHVEEAVLARLHQDAMLLSVHRQVGDDHRAHRVVIPGIRRRRLIVPGVLAGRELQRQNRREIEIVTALGIAIAVIPWRPVTGAEEHQIRLSVVEDRVPDRAAAAEFPPLAAPGGRGPLHRLVLEAVLGIAGDGIEAPGELAGLGIVSAEVAPHSVLGTGLPDQYLPFHHSRGAGDRVVLALVDGQRGPHLFSAMCVDGHQAAIERAQVDLAVPGGDAAIDDAAAHVADPLAGGLRIVLPELLAAARVERVDLAPGGGDIDDAVDVERRAVLTQVRIVVREPGETELFDVTAIDARKPAETLLVVGAPVSHPLRGLGGGLAHARGGDVGR